MRNATAWNRKQIWCARFFPIFWVAILLLCNAAAAKKHPPAHPIDLNTATLGQLEQLPGVGPVTAHAILDFRAKSGPFRSVNDLLAVPRISKKRLEKIRPYVTVGPPVAAKKHAESLPSSRQLLSLTS